MPIENPAIIAFNRGRVSTRVLARTDIDRIRWSAETQTNWVPRTLGSMMLRPGWGYLGSTLDDSQAVHLPFIFATDDTALIELTDGSLRVYVSDALITRPAVTAAVDNGAFSTDLSGWTNADETGATSSWATGGFLSLVGTGFASARLRQEVAVNEASTVHALRIMVERGPVEFRAGSSAGAEDYVADTTLGAGEHSLAFTPTGNFHIQLSASSQAAALVGSVAVESAGALALTAPWAEADLRTINSTQSGDVIYLACDGYQQRKIERRPNDSWSIVKYEPRDGPFRIINTGPVRLTPSGLNGDITVSSSAALFRSGHVGGLFSIDSAGQQVEATITAEDQFTDEIRVTGVDNSRIFQITLGSLTSTSTTVTLQRSVDEPGSWVDVTSYTTDQTATDYDDGLDNQIIYYRIGVKAGDYSSGTISANLTYSGGSATGVVRITAVASETSASASVLRQLGATTASSDWREGIWSDFRGYPSALALFEGRLWWFGKTRWIGSVSDAYESFDPDTEGDSAPINRTIGFGPVDYISWALPLQRLAVGTEGAEIVARSSSLDEPLSVTEFSLKDPSTQGSARVAAVKADARGIFVQRSGTRVYSLEWDINRGSYGDYSSLDLTALVPEMGEPSIIRLAVQRQPDTRIHCIRSDGTVALLIFDYAENVLCWVDIETDGEVEDAAVLPGTLEDRVYYTVKRTINGTTMRYLEKWALESECGDLTLNKQADAFVTYSQVASATIAGLDHLEGEDVVVWDNGICLADANGDIATFTVSGGAITVTNGGVTYEATDGVVGLSYTAPYKSTKLVYAAALGTPLNQQKRVSHIGFVAENLHARGIRFGPDFDSLVGMPAIEGGKAVDADAVHATYDEPVIPFPGGWTVDSRICIQAQAPRPATMLAITLAGVRTNERA